MDRLSDLPDEIVCHILSFIPRTKFSVQTSVLSKRWRFLWAHVPLLSFGFDDTRRSDIITNIVLQHKHDIHTFLISISDRHDLIEEEFQSWIVNITTRNIRDLIICFQPAIPFISVNLKLPQCLFTCRTLVDLSLHGCGGIPTSGIYFPALKKLELDYIPFESHESLAPLISGCPVLEELIIQGRILGQCCVSSPTLTDLELRLLNAGLRFEVYLNIPALRYLLLYSCMPDELSARALDSLIEADIILFKHQGNFIYARNVLPFVVKLCNVKLLTLTIHGMAVINDSAFSASTIKFHNLTKLDLSAANLGFVTFFLENANNLQVLEFKILSSMVNDDNRYGWMEPKQVPACLISHLQIVNLRSDESFEHGFDVLRYILVNAKVLKKMKVPTPRHHKPDWEMKFETLKRVALFERGSQECELVFD